METLLKYEHSTHVDEKIQTNIKFIDSRFGKLELDVNKNIYFPYGLVGLESQKHFGLANFPTNVVENFKILQALDDDSLSLITYICNIQKVLTFIDKIDIERCSNLFKIPLKDLGIIFVTSISSFEDKNGQVKQKISINLRAPLIIDTNKNIGIQYVFTDNKYSIKHEL